jgi:hypothetical protein
MTNSSSRDVQISIPNWLFRYIAVLLAAWVIFWAVLLLIAGSGAAALAVLGIGLGLIPLGLLLTYIYWRFFWWLTAAWLTCASFFWGSIVIPALLSGNFTSRQDQFPPIGAFIPNQLPRENIVLGLVVVAVLLIIFALQLVFPRRASASAQADPTNRPTPEFAFDDSVPVVDDYMGRVATHVAGMGYKTSVERDTVRVYKGRSLVGLVKCVDRPGKPVAPLILREAERAATAAGVKTIYLATSGYFPNETKNEAARMGIKLIEIK